MAAGNRPTSGAVITTLDSLGFPFNRRLNSHPTLAANRFTHCLVARPDPPQSSQDSRGRAPPPGEPGAQNTPPFSRQETHQVALKTGDDEALDKRQDGLRLKVGHTFSATSSLVLIPGTYARAK
jgi:hypothetical protein